MAMLVLDSWTEQRVKAEREVSGADRYDEIWDGAYVVVPASFRLVHGDARPTVEVAHRDGVQRWLV